VIEVVVFFSSSDLERCRPGTMDRSKGTSLLGSIYTPMNHTIISVIESHRIVFKQHNCTRSAPRFCIGVGPQVASGEDQWEAAGAGECGFSVPK
jgi:hypothetical protein